MTTLYFHPLSMPSLYPVFVARAAGLDVDVTLVDLATKEQEGDDYRKINPFGKVPAMVDGDLAIGESSAIGRYLAQKAGSDLYGADLREQALIDQWVEFCVHHVRSNTSKLNFHRFIAGLVGGESKPDVIAESEGYLASNLPHVELALDRDGHLHGDRLTLADIALVVAMEPTKTAQIDLTDFPVLEAWLGEMRKADWYTAVHNHYGAEMGL